MKLMYWIVLGIVNSIFMVLEIIRPAEAGHSGFWWNSIPLFYAVYGFVGCASIVVVAKFFGEILLQKRDDYYDAR